jgi:hypothetical protein
VTHTIRHSVAENGYVFVPNYQPEKDAASVAEALGKPITPWNDRLIQDLIPRATSSPNTYSGIYGLQGFPFHTDLAHWRVPPRYLLLRCRIGYPDVPTLVIDGRALMEALTAEVLTRAVFRPRRPRDGKLVLLRLCEPTEDGRLLRWDEIFLRPVSKIGDVASQRIRDWLVQVEPLSISLTALGDTLLIDNWRMLHARAPIPPGREGRKIERVYLESLR